MDTQPAPWGKLLAFNAPGLTHIDCVRQQYRVGRDPKQSDLVVHDQTLRCSKNHFKIYLTGGIPCFEDCSSNGTIVNGTRIHKKMIPLTDRAEIEIKWDLLFLFVNTRDHYMGIPPLINDRYYVFESQVLGQGSFAIVKVAVDLHTLERLACKIIDTRRIQLNKTSHVDASLAAIQQEISVLRQVEHPNIVSIKDVVVMQDRNVALIFLSRISGGELFDHIVNGNGVEESEAKFIFYQLLLAVKYLHDVNICHRDLKAENVLLESSKPFSRLLISDFGMAKSLQNSLEQMQTKCGTFTYLAPEILDSPGGYSKQVDCWALGVLLYTMLGGALPFGTDQDHTRLLQRIRRADYSLSDERWKDISPEAKDLISRLLQVDANRRLTVEQALHHPWISNHQEVLARLYGKMLVKSGIRHGAAPGSVAG
ncbi:hypothetical protein HK105_203040 [Polyrhizophydium stewartii]|uniref:Uncharacterized protein n=1 Tax=Polyrhizophydium stewartii TaxID=2732419 RepID=A0ABR4ND12_9FUNG